MLHLTHLCTSPVVCASLLPDSLHDLSTFIFVFLCSERAESERELAQLNRSLHELSRAIGHMQRKVQPLVPATVSRPLAQQLQISAQCPRCSPPCCSTPSPDALQQHQPLQMHSLLLYQSAQCCDEYTALVTLFNYSSYQLHDVYLSATLSADSTQASARKQRLSVLNIARCTIPLLSLDRVLQGAYPTAK